MTRSALRSFGAVLTATVAVAFAASLLGCASYGPATRVAVQDVKSLIGTWKGTVYRSSFAPDSVTLTIHDDGSFDVVSVLPERHVDRNRQDRRERRTPPRGGQERARHGNVAEKPRRRSRAERRNDPQ